MPPPPLSAKGRDEMHVGNFTQNHRTMSLLNLAPHQNFLAPHLHLISATPQKKQKLGVALAKFSRAKHLNQKSVNPGVISALHTTIRQSFKNVTCPFKYTVRLCVNIVVYHTSRRFKLKLYYFVKFVYQLQYEICVSSQVATENLVTINTHCKR